MEKLDQQQIEKEKMQENKDGKVNSYSENFL
jgi:hypothetical protein